MTLAQLTAARDALYTQYLAWINAGCPQSYALNGRSLTKCSADFWLKQLNQLDGQITAAGSTGSFSAAQFRRPE
jgi:hypothetical protein